jgi:hypothetical protein
VEVVTTRGHFAALFADYASTLRGVGPAVELAAPHRRRQAGISLPRRTPHKARRVLRQTPDCPRWALLASCLRGTGASDMRVQGYRETKSEGPAPGFGLLPYQ